MNGLRFADVCAALLREGIGVSFHAPGRSMTPAIRDGERITVRPANLEGARPGDVVLFLDGRAVRAHRLRARVRPGAPPAIRADLPGSDLEPVRREHVLGVVVSVRRDGRETMPRLSFASRLADARLRARRALDRLLGALVPARTTRPLPVGQE